MPDHGRRIEATFVKERGLVATMRDGTRLVADAWLPRGRGPWPVLLQRLPYGRSVASSPVLPSPGQLARRGFAVVVQDVRGRGDSGGVFAPFVHEAEDGAATIEWAASLPFSTGDVVTYGFSYQGLAQLYAAAKRPRGLRGIAPMMSSDQPYESWTYQGGCLRVEFAATWAAQLAAQVPGAPVVAPDFDALPVARVLDPQPSPWFTEWTRHPDDDAYWAKRRPDLGAIDVPVFSVLGYFDDFAPGMARVIDRLGADAVCGPWAHMPWGTRLGDLEVEGATPAVAIDAFLSWLDRVVGRAPPAPRRVRWCSIGAGPFGWNAEWRDAPSWPPPHAVHRWSATGGGNANSRHGDGALVPGPSYHGPPDVLVAEPLVPYPGTSVPLADVAGAEDRRDVLCYTGPALSQPLGIAGSPTAEVSAGSDSNGFDVVVVLCVVTPDGRSRQLATGARRVGPERNRHPAQTISVPLSPIGVTLGGGTRLRLDVAAARFPVLDRNPHQDGYGPGLAPRSAHRVAAIEVSGCTLDLPVITP